MDPAKQNIRVQRLVTAISVALLITKLLAYFLTHSVAILTDALESIVNVAAGFLGLYSLSLSAKPRDADHPYGHGKIEFISAAIEGILIMVASVLIVVEAIQTIRHPSQIHQLDIGIVLIIASAAINYLAGMACVRTGKRNNSVALVASGKHLQSDTYTTVGIIAGLIAIRLTGLLWLDGAVALAFASYTFYVGFRIIRTSVAGIMDESDKQLLRKFVSLVDTNRKKNWMDLHNLRIIKYGNTLHIDCHLTVPWYFNVHEAHAEIDALAQITRDDFSHTIELFVHSDGCLPISCPICIKDDCPVRQHAFEKQIAWTVENVQANEKHHRDTTPVKPA